MAKRKFNNFTTPLSPKYKAPSHRFCIMSRLCKTFWTRLLLRALQILHWSFTTQEQYNKERTLFLDLQNPVFIFLKQKSNKWTCFVWIWANLFSPDLEAAASAQKEMKKKCSVPRWKVRTPWPSAQAHLSLLLVTVHTAGALSDVTCCMAGRGKGCLSTHIHVQTGSVFELLTSACNV